MKEITIANTNILVKEFKGKRVVTFKDIDTVHKRPTGTARRNFNTNKNRFIEGEDYFRIQPNEIRTVGITSPNGGIVLTESGYLMLAKSLTDDLSWTVQRELVKSYFRLKEITTSTCSVCPNNPYAYINKTYRGRPILTANDIASLYNISPATLYNHIKTKLSSDRDYKLLEGDELKEYNNENFTLPRCRRSVFVIFNTGLSRIMSHYDLDESKTPLFMIEQNGYVVDGNVQQLMEYVRRELKGVEALTYLIESDDTPNNLENYRKILVKKLSAINWWKSDVKYIKLGTHRISLPELDNIHNGVCGMKY